MSTTTPSMGPSSFGAQLVSAPAPVYTEHEDPLAHNDADRGTQGTVMSSPASMNPTFFGAETGATSAASGSQPPQGREQLRVLLDTMNSDEVRELLLQALAPKPAPGPSAPVEVPEVPQAVARSTVEAPSLPVSRTDLEALKDLPGPAPTNTTYAPADAPREPLGLSGHTYVTQPFTKADMMGTPEENAASDARSEALRQQIQNDPAAREAAAARDQEQAQGEALIRKGADLANRVLGMFGKPPIDIEAKLEKARGHRI